MKYIQAALIVILLITNKRFREKWRQAADRLTEANDEVEASLRRLSAVKNGGKPRIHLL